MTEQRQEGLRKFFVTKTGHLYIPTTESLGPGLERALIQPQNLGSICGYWTRPILGLKVNHRFNDKLRYELADHGGYLTVFRQLRSQGSVFLVVYKNQSHGE